MMSVKSETIQELLDERIEDYKYQFKKEVQENITEISTQANVIALAQERMAEARKRLKALEYKEPADLGIDAGE